jgi:hypothetical protein
MPAARSARAALASALSLPCCFLGDLHGDLERDVMPDRLVQLDELPVDLVGVGAGQVTTCSEVSTLTECSTTESIPFSMTLATWPTTFLATKSSATCFSSLSGSS